MIASSAFVLSALTMTGIYMKSNNESEQDDGYMLDFTALEEDVQNKAQEIAGNDQAESTVDNAGNDFTGELAGLTGSPDDDLDYLPMEVGSGQVSIPGLTDGILDEPVLGDAGPGSAGDMAAAEDVILPAGDTPGAADLSLGNTGAVEQADPVEEEIPAEEAAGEQEPDSHSGEDQEQPPEDSGQEEPAAQTMHFTETEGLLRPVSGEVLIPFSMDSSVYFSTLDQFKYNPAMMIGAEQGAGVSACAEGVVVAIFEDEEIGHAVTMDLGDGYQITYGQLSDINVGMNSHVEPGQTIASVAAPTKYFSVEGSNLYLKLTSNGTPVNPEALFR